MKIGFDAKRYFNNNSGLGNYSRWLVNALYQDNEFDIHLYHTSEKPKYKPTTHSPKGKYKLFSSLWRVKGIVRNLTKDNIQIYHGLSNELPFGIHRSGIKTVVTIHDVINIRYPEYYNALDRIIYKKKLTYAVQYADTIVVPSEQTSNDLKQYFNADKSKIKVIPVSITPKIINAAPSTTIQPYMLCVSGFSKRKNLTRLVEAYNTLETDIQLVIAGRKGDFYKEVKKNAASNKNIRILLDVDDERLSELYQNCMFSIYPSEYEGFGIPILEAFTYGKTVATSNVSSMPEVGGDAAVYFDPFSVESISEKLNYLLNNDNRISLESKVKTQLQKFDSKSLIETYKALYKSLI